MLREHIRMMVAAALQVSDQVGIGEGVWIDGLQFPVFGNGSWFAVFVPIAKLLSPEFLWENLFSALEPFGDFCFRSRHHLTVAEAVNVAHVQSIDEQTVKPGKIVGALRKCWWM